MSDFKSRINPTARPLPREGSGLGEAARAEAVADAEMEQAMREVEKAQPPPDVQLKRMWDAELEAELEQALSGFDASSVEVAAPRKKAEKSDAPRSGRAQDAHPGRKTGKVIAVRGKSVFIDLGGKSEGVLPVDLFAGEPPAPGATIEVDVDHFDPDEGLHILRLKGAAVDANWENLKRGVVVEARATKVVKSGLEVDVGGIRGFMPISQIDLNRVEDAAAYLNQKFKAIVTDASPRERNLVVSRREFMEREREEMREKTWKSLEEGQEREGVVRSIKPFGAFVDLGGVDGLLPIGELSWSRVARVEDLVRSGDTIKVKVLKIDPVARKLTLGLKQLAPSPWETAPIKYRRGAMVPGKVTRLAEFGAFVELEPGIEGLIHVSELSPNRVRRVSDIVKVGQEVEVRVLTVDPDEKRIGLSLVPADGSALIDEAEDEADDTPRAPEPEPKVPLKGGLGDRDTFNRRFGPLPG